MHTLQETRARQTIFLVDSDQAQVELLAAQIGYYGYAVQIFNQLETMLTTARSAAPAAAIMDIGFLKQEPQPDLSALQSCALFFLSGQGDMETRLLAARAGGHAFFTRPVDTGVLIDQLDQLIVHQDTIPYRILIVDDSFVQASVNAAHLRRAGMETEIVSDPLAIMSPLADFNPDLILLDMYMPTCTGMELARIIRQMEAFVSVPLVFLSAETDRGKQLEAVGLGGDDFLTKPIKPDHLIAAVTSRVERYRNLRTLMLHDSLTGLFNHTTIKERLLQEYKRAVRQTTLLSFAMLDLDHFKAINDNYGHSAGDRVLKSLAHLLIKRLRNTDIVGRYGGEEFAIVFPNTQPQVAVQVVDELRNGFSHIQHYAGTDEFAVTFSAGVADFPHCQDPSCLSETADKALYHAKQRGRNQVYYGA
jgi:diguanylate cyclase (GGDEF)-like protein